MKPSRFNHWLRVSMMLVLCSFTAYACGGGQFTAGGAAGGETATAGTSGDGSGASGGLPEHKIACQGPEDCDDSDPCTVDQCGADGACTRAPKCGATEKCCGGACGECCDSQDCDDGVKCTDDQCFAGGCSHSPNNSLCAAAEYCSATADCRRKESCVDSAGCDDGDFCTDDACSAASLCDHTATECQGSSLCCPGVGCAECCSDSNCDDKDPCTTDSCAGNKCEHKALCVDGQHCCASSDKSSATCGTCCSAADCDDSVICTKDSCTQGTCGHTDSCASGSNCDPTTKACVKNAECIHDTDCKTTNVCQTSAKCVSGKCAYGDCGGLKCCSDGCKACCADTDCNDQVACTKDSCNGGLCSHAADSGSCAAATPICDPKLGCLACASNADCNDNNDCTTDLCDTTTHRCSTAKLCNEKCCCIDADCQGGITTAALPIGSKCTYQVCSSGTCTAKTQVCAVGSSCCIYGCCGIQTQ